MNGTHTHNAVLARALRVYQWPKNFFVFAALVFAEELLDPMQFGRSVVAFVAFCAASGSMYLFNDIMDIEKDRAHPEKSKRPLPSGEMTAGTAGILAVLCAAVSLGLAAVLGPAFVAITVFYVILTFLYSVVLKHLIIVDVMVVASGFVVRAMAGAIAVRVVFSNWLVVCTFFLALFLALSKRRHEVLVLEGDKNGAHRRALQYYSIVYLDYLIVIAAAATVITYTIYTCSPEVVERLGTDKLYLTLPFVVYGLFRYFHVVHYDEGGGDPAQTLLREWPLAVTIVLYGLVSVGIIYGARLWPG